QDIACLGQEGLDGLGVLALVNVDGRSDVALESAASRETRNSGIQHPAVFAIGPPQPVLNLEAFAAFEGFPVSLQAGFEVVGVHFPGPAVAQLVIHRLACKSKPGFVEEAALAV